MFRNESEFTLWIEARIKTFFDAYQANGGNITTADLAAISAIVSEKANTVDLAAINAIVAEKANMVAVQEVAGKVSALESANQEKPIQIQFTNDVINRKLLLYQGPENDHQYYGLGVNGGVLRYQVLSLTDRHVFYAGNGPANSTEIASICGNGTVAIGVQFGTSKLHIKGMTGCDQLRLEKSYTPTGTGDANGLVGDVCWNDTHFHVKTNAGWKRAALTTF